MYTSYLFQNRFIEINNCIVFKFYTSALHWLTKIFNVIIFSLGVFSPADTNLSPQQRETLLNCGAECRGVLVSLTFKMFLLAVASWAIFLRPVKATMPRIYVFRAVVLALVSICCGTFWLFYVVQVTEGKSV